MGTQMNTLDVNAHGFDPESYAQLREVFDFLDRDRNGSVSLDEIRYLIDLIKPDGSEETSAEILAEIDANHDGHVSFEEFIEVIGRSRTMAYTNEDAQRAFRIFAESNAPKGCISKGALRAALVSYGDAKELEDVDIDRLIAQFSNTLEDWVDYKSRIDRHIPK